MAIVSTTGPVPADVKGWNPYTGGTVFAAPNRRPRRTPLTRLMAGPVAESAHWWWAELDPLERATWKLTYGHACYNRRGTTWPGSNGWTRWWSRTAAEFLSRRAPLATATEEIHDVGEPILTATANAASQVIAWELSNLTKWDLEYAPLINVFQVSPRSRYHVGHDPSTRLIDQVRNVPSGQLTIGGTPTARYRLYAGRWAGIYVRAHDGGSWHTPDVAEMLAG